MRVAQMNKYATLLSAVGATGAGSAQDLSQGPLNKHAWEIRVTGSPTGFRVDLEGSLDGTNFYQLDTYTTVANTLRVVSSTPARSIRANLVTLTGGSSPTCTVRYLGMRA